MRGSTETNRAAEQSDKKYVYAIVNPKSERPIARIFDNPVAAERRAAEDDDLYVDRMPVEGGEY